MVQCSAGGQVFGATVLNQLATLVVRVTASGSTTVLAKIVATSHENHPLHHHL